MALGSTVLLPCPLPPTSSRLSNLSLLRVTWTRGNGSEVASFGPAQQQHVQGGFLWNPPAFLRGNFSLTASDVVPAHQGAYVCSVSYNSSRLGSHNVSLSVLGEIIWGPEDGVRYKPIKSLYFIHETKPD